MPVSLAYELVQCQSRNPLSILEIDGCLRIVPEGYMQNYTIVDRVQVMPVRPPAAGFNMNFNVSPHKPMAGSDNCIQQISTPVIINPSGVYYL
jgi:hypothetical protein